MLHRGLVSDKLNRGGSFTESNTGTSQITRGRNATQMREMCFPPKCSEIPGIPD